MAEASPTAPQEELVEMEVTRRYPGAETHGVGEVIRVTPAVAKSMEDARPPFGKRVQAAAAEISVGEPAAAPVAPVAAEPADVAPEAPAAPARPRKGR